MSQQVRYHAVALDPFQESVYECVPEVFTAATKATRYKSRYAPKAAAEYKAGLKAAASMGPSKVSVSPPDQFLKKHGGLLASSADSMAKKAARVEHVDDTLRPPVPKRHELVHIKTIAPKDFIHMNALDVINATAAKKTTEGPRYIHKPDFAKVPEYLAARKHEAAHLAAAWKEQQQHALATEQLHSGLILMPQTERLAMLEGLRKNWEKLNLEYQKLSLTVDTVPKIARKVSLEQNLKHVEEYIKKFSNPNVLVNFNDVFE